MRAFIITTLLSTIVLVPPARAAEPECSAEQQTGPAAVQMAERCDRPVEILGQRTENSQTFAKPNGGFTTERSMEPRWTRKSDGAWTPIDTTLKSANGSVAPAAAVLPVEFSAGGSGPAARLRDGTRELAITWPLGALPRPTLSGSDVTYPEVLPGVDLKLTASALGFSEVLVVKTREAAKNPKLAKVKFNFATKNVNTAPTDAGGLVAKDGQGKVVFSSPTPVMWETAPKQSGVSAQAEQRAPRRVTMPVTATNGELTVTPDATMMSDATTQFPIYIDPSWTGRIKDNVWATVASRGDLANKHFGGSSGTFLYNADIIGNAGAGRVCDNPYNNGTCPAGTEYNVESYFQMDLSGVAGKTITGASFRIKQLWSWTCNPASEAGLWITNGVGDSTTWNNRPAWWDLWSASASASHRYGSEYACSGPGDVEFNVTNMVSHIVGEDKTAITLGLRPHNPNDVKQWKRYDTATAVLAIDYNSPPNVPDQLSVNASSCEGRPFVGTVTPTIRARVGDPDPESMTARFEWARVRDDGTRAEVGEITDVSPVANGTTADFTVPDNKETFGLDTGVLDRSDTIVGTGDWDNDGRSDVLSRDGGGYLYLFPGDGRKLGGRVKIGLGWNGFTIAGVADWDSDGKKDIIARNDSDGELFVYPGEGVRGISSQPRSRIGIGFGGYQFAGLADHDKDGKQDLIAKDWNGELWLYPGEGKRTPSTQSRAALGYGWGPYNIYGVIDRTGDGAPDIIAENEGTLWLYLGSGKRAPYTGSPYRHEIGIGWSGARAMTMPDFNGDGAADVMAHIPYTRTWQLYPGVVGTTYGGTQWAAAATGLAEGGLYAYRVAAKDTYRWSEFSGWCEFVVDTTAPEAPKVTASVYKDKSSGCPADGCGSLGVSDTFTFSSTSPDVVKYLWGFTDPPTMSVPASSAVVRWTPPSSGPKNLYVRAVDRAGLHTTSLHKFTVNGPTREIGQWLFADDPSQDMTGNHNLNVTGEIAAVDGRMVGGTPAFRFDGTMANTASTAKVLNTGKGFSVSAWVRLTGDAADRTVVSQQGSATSAFRLGYSSASRKWVFSLAESDVTNATQRSVSSGTNASTGVWTHLTGTYDTLEREARLYVNGELQQSSTVVSAGFDAAGELWIGRRLHSGATVEPWHGDLTDVRAWDRAITGQETLALFDPVAQSEVGKWLFDETKGRTATDTSQYAHNLTLTLAPGANWGEGKVAGGLQLGGAGSASSAEPVIDTDQSFTVDVWAKLAEAGTPRTIVVQRGPFGFDPFRLRYDGAKWSVEMPNSPSDPTVWWRATSQTDAITQKWTHLVAVYDADARTLRLWMDDVLQNTATGVVGWNSMGVVSVGRSGMGEYWYGGIDEMKIYQGTLAPVPMTTTPPSGSSVSGDSRAEIVSVDADGGVRAFLNVDGGYPGLPQRIGSGWTVERTSFADIDADGRAEIIALDQDGTIRAFRNVNGMNDFPFGAQYTIGKAASGEPGRTQFADVDGDGRADRVSIDPDGRVRVYRNLFGLNGLGQVMAFSATPIVVKVTALVPQRIRFADIDGDRKADFITINDDGTVLCYRNTAGLGYGTYDGYREIGYGWSPDRTLFADINGDGPVEIIALRPDGTVWSYPNLYKLNGFPFGFGAQIGSGWFEPARVLFS